MDSKKKLVLGIGNTILGDDGIGILVTKHFEDRFHENADFLCTEEMGLSLLDHLSGYDEAVLIDSVVTGEAAEGEVQMFSVSDFISQPQRSVHYIGVPELYFFAKKLSISFPKKVHIIGIEIRNSHEICTSISGSLEKKIPSVFVKVERMLKEILCCKEEVR